MDDNQKLEHLKFMHEIDKIKIDKWFQGFMAGMVFMAIVAVVITMYASARKMEALQEHMEFRAIEVGAGRYVVEDGQKVFKFIGE